MKKTTFGMTVCLGLTAGTASAVPFPVSQPSADATTFSFFRIDAKKAVPSVAVAKARLTRALAPYKIKPCYVTADLNGSINCPLTASWYMVPTPGEFYTYNRESSLQVLPPIADTKDFNKGKVYKQVWAANFFTGSTVTPNRTYPVGSITFTRPVTEFSFKVDAGQALAPSATAIQLVIKGPALPAEGLALAPQSLTPGKPSVVGVGEPLGFTEVQVTALGGQNDARAYVADQFAFVPMP